MEKWAAFGVKVPLPGNETLEAWWARGHDDLVLEVVMAMDVGSFSSGRFVVHQVQSV